MARSSIARLLRRRGPLPPEVAAAIEQLGLLAEATPSLGAAAALQSVILRIVYAAPVRASPFALAPDRAAEKLRAGTPLLHGEGVPLDIPVLAALLLRLCGAVEVHVEQPGSARELAAALKRQALDVSTLAQQAIGGQAGAIRARATELGLNGDLLCSLLRFSLFPALTELAASLAPPRAATAWAQCYCPACGSWPLLGEHRGLEQLRYLRCGLCASEWQADRLLCPFCGNRQHAGLAYLHVEGAEQQRAATCESCHGYLKVLASLAPFTPLDLAIQDLATLHLDLIAIERGYAAPV